VHAVPGYTHTLYSRFLENPICLPCRLFMYGMCTRFRAILYWSFGWGLRTSNLGKGSGSGMVSFERALVSSYRPSIVIRPPEGRASVLPQMYLFFLSPLVLRAPSTDRPETLPHGRNLNEFYNATSKTRGGGGRSPLPKKIWGQKHAKFRSISVKHFRL